jgi:hypothetical protein
MFLKDCKIKDYSLKSKILSREQRKKLVHCKQHLESTINTKNRSE